MSYWKDEFPREGRFFETESGILYKGDSSEILKEFPCNMVDLIVTDPPYCINYRTCYRKDKKHRFCEPIKGDSDFSVIEKTVPLFHNILKEDRAVYCFSSWKTLEVFKHIFSMFFKIKNVIIWVKNNWSAGDLLAQYGQQYECIIYANKGRAPIRGKRLSDVWFFDRVAGKKQLHQNQKPIPLIERILHKHSDSHDLVLDPFVGSGTTAVACELNNRRWIAIEIDEEFCEITKNRISSAVKHLQMKP